MSTNINFFFDINLFIFTYLYIIFTYYLPTFVMMLVIINHNVNTLSSLIKLIKKSDLLKLLFLLIFLNFCSIPPLPGFFIKFYLLKYLIFFNNSFITLMFILYNFFIFYFFLKNIKFLALYNNLFCSPLKLSDKETLMVILCIYIMVFFIILQPMWINLIYPIFL